MNKVIYFQMVEKLESKKFLERFVLNGKHFPNCCWFNSRAIWLIRWLTDQNSKRISHCQQNYLNSLLKMLTLSRLSIGPFLEFAPKEMCTKNPLKRSSNKLCPKFDNLVLSEHSTLSSDSCLEDLLGALQSPKK